MLQQWIRCGWTRIWKCTGWYRHFPVPTVFWIPSRPLEILYVSEICKSGWIAPFPCSVTRMPEALFCCRALRIIITDINLWMVSQCRGMWIWWKTWIISFLCQNHRLSENRTRKILLLCLVRFFVWEISCFPLMSSRGTSWFLNVIYRITLDVIRTYVMSGNASVRKARISRMT